MLIFYGNAFARVAQKIPKQKPVVSACCVRIERARRARRPPVPVLEIMFGNCDHWRLPPNCDCRSLAKCVIAIHATKKHVQTISCADALASAPVAFATGKSNGRVFSSQWAVVRGSVGYQKKWNEFRNVALQSTSRLAKLRPFCRKGRQTPISRRMASDR